MTTKQIVDIVVRYKGAAVPGTLSDTDILPATLMLRYNEESAAAVGRRLERVGERTNTIRNASLIENTMNEMRRKIKSDTLGQVFIYGSSSGGRNAIDLAVRLSQNNIFSIGYVGIIDAAFFPNETLTTPNNITGKPTNIPMFNTQGLIVAFKRENFFQTAGNQSELTSHGRQFTSDMASKEIHGNVPFFDTKNMTNKVISPPPVPRFGHSPDDEFHGRLIVVATPIVQNTIADLLDKLIPQGPSLNFIIPTLDPLETTVYVVVSGDNLSKIARRFYGNESLWPKIYAANRAVIGNNPNLIRVGQKLVIPK